MNIIKTKLSKILLEAIDNVYWQKYQDLSLDTPPKKDLWDFCFGPFILSKVIWKKPALISEELKKYLENNSNFIELSVAWPYLNMKLSYNFYTEIFNNYEINIPNIWNNKNIVVDYIGTNIWKAMHIGHMCPSNQWQVTCNLFRKLGYNVIWDSHLWDWWIIFWKLIYAYNTWWNEEWLKTWAVDYLQSLYIKATSEAETNPELEEKYRKEFKKLSLWDEQSKKLWYLFTKYSLENVQIQNDRLQVKATYDIGESFYEGIWLEKLTNHPDLKYDMNYIVKELIEKNIATKNDDNSVWVVFEESKKIPSVMLEKRDWTHGYLASDLTAVKYRYENWNPEKIIYHIDVRQDLHIKQVTEISKKAWWLPNTSVFFAWNWYISLKNWAMSSRTGNIIKLVDLLNEAVSRAKKIVLEKNPEISENDLNEIWEIIWIWAIKYGYLSKSRMSDMIFDWDEFMTFEWNSFPYVAYSFVRALRVLEKSWFSKNQINNISNKAIFSSFDEIDLFKEITFLNEVLLSDSENLLHHNLVWYSYNLARKFWSFYNNVSILNDEDENNKILKLNLVSKYIETQKILYEILAIKLPNKM